MASSVDVVSALGHGLVASQVGPSAGYDAVDIRRAWTDGRREGVLSYGAYAVSQRAAGANMTVDVAASTGDGALVLGDSVTSQGLYKVAPHTAVINVDIAAANATNPRLDIVILEVKDDAHDVGGLNIARVRVVSGTATSGATLDNRTGAPSLPVSSLHLADVLVAAADTSITTSEIRDKRVVLWTGGAGGKSIIATAESRTNTAYGLLTTSDVVRNIVLPTDGLIMVMFDARWQESVSGAGRAAIFVGATQLDVAYGNVAAGHGVQAAAGAGDATYSPLASCPIGLVGMDTAAVAVPSPVTTGQAVGFAPSNTLTQLAAFQIGSSAADSALFPGGAPCRIVAAAGTYDISVQFKSSSGSVTVKDRKLWCWTQAFG